MSAAVSGWLADKTSNKSQFLRVFGQTISVSGQDFQRVHVYDFTHACSDGPFNMSRQDAFF
jgi:hypothetical protein